LEQEEERVLPGWLGNEGLALLFSAAAEAKLRPFGAWSDVILPQVMFFCVLE